MDFKDQQAIYLQIAEHVGEQILLGRWRDNDKIPSVRELAVALEVNPNTVMRAYEHLQQVHIIFTKRGMGYFVADNAMQQLRKIRKEQFMTDELPLLLRKIALMNIDFNDIEQAWKSYQETFQKEQNEKK
ncbi:GntR family transcriptional regulator [Pedobacter yulinensis]|uniref:GntR family transcriptional regulator n=1 Tax=Pedobacter yulinensis TaxID=2126353 RepID=A0A2T3HIV9_9SPHI|nr:GntR family transcriptional regulator [Pedobacter yulinensis]PST82376.1 GntR family transcriptional regulator [Pedobacter yulinensis]